MTKRLDINVEHLTRVEGHGDIVVRVREGELETCHFRVVEAPRFFEPMLKGRSWQEAALITSRICGICSIGHQMTSLKATEAALGIPISEQTLLLRKLLVDGSMLSSHILHILFLAAPDGFGAPSAFHLAATHPEAVRLALELKRLANDLCDAIGGRMIHPITCVPGGFTQLPKEHRLEELRNRYEAEMLPKLHEAADLVYDIKDTFPDFTRETEFISLGSQTDYPFYDGQIVSSDTDPVPVSDYLSVTNEYVVPHSTAKHTRHVRDSYMVGALARLNNNYDLLTDSAKKVAERFGLRPVCHNPFMNTIAQLVECVHCAETAIERIETLLDTGIQPEEPPRNWRSRGGRGVGATEVPRGILFHEYVYDATGHILRANCIIPTNQNFGNIDLDMQALVPSMLEQGLEPTTMQQNLEMLVRAYDPCISCSVHMVTI